MLRGWGRVAGLALIAGCGDDGSGPPMFADGGPLTDVGPSGCASDEACDDGIFCNGAEQCLDRACTAGVVPECEDADACTVDRCSEEMRACVHLPPDADGDGHETLECGGDDCDDADPLRYPGNSETCDPDRHDEDCDATTLGERDEDRDGAVDAACCNGDACGEDCDDRSRRVHPLQIEVCDHADNDCDAMVDEGQTAAGFADADRDFHGDPATGMRGCIGDAGFVLSADDCDDASAARHPGQREVCDTIDNDCDASIDEETGPATWYRDADGDGFGATASGTMLACAPPPGHVLLGTDCDDAQRGVHPAAVEACNGVDDDCNGRADFVVGPANSEDDDSDGHADLACPGGDDCDDERAETHPGAPEICDARDNDCDAMVDGPAAVPALFYPDVDRDGYGDAGATGTMTCAPSAGQVATTGDCDDSDAAIHPGATDACGSGDEDCDTRVDEDGTDPVTFHADADGDGFGAVGGATRVACTAPMGFGPAGDCNDADAAIHPAAVDRCNLRDDDCNGTIDDAAEAAAACGLTGATAACTTGTCTVTSCDMGRGDCDGADPNGCEVDLLSTPAHCGACARPCRAGDACMGGTCVGSRLTSLAVGWKHTYALRESGGGAVWGSGYLGDGTVGPRLVPAPAALADAVRVSMGNRHGCAVRRGGHVACWGEGFYGALGTGITDQGLPIDVPGITDAIDVAVGEFHTCVVRATGAVLCFGNGENGRLGDDDLTNHREPTPRPVLGIDDAIGVMATRYAACAVRRTGQVACWGNGDAVGNGTGMPSGLPVVVAGLSDAVTAGRGSGTRDTVCVIRASGAVACWGLGASGQLGDGRACGFSAASPVAMAGITDAAEVASSLSNTCVRTRGGEVWCTGDNIHGQLANGTFTGCSGTPVRIAGIASATGVAVGQYHGCAIRTPAVGAQEVLCWGRGMGGELGNGAGADSPMPVAVSGVP